MSVPRYHHFIPAFYLRQWCDPTTGKLVEYSIKHDKLVPKLVGPDATGFEFDLYAFQKLPPEQAQVIEQAFFNYADRTASDALNLHITNDAAGWNNELLSAWSRFMIALQLRHPDAMPEMRAASHAIWNGSGERSQAQYEKVKKPGDPDTVDEYLARDDPLSSVKARVKLIIRAFDNEVVGAHVNKMKWAVIDVSASPHRLLTSDRPVAWSKITKPYGMITMPISPAKLFVAVNDLRIFDRLDARKPREIASRVNTQVVERARRFVWASDQSQTLFVKKHMSKKLEPTPLFPNLGRV